MLSDQLYNKLESKHTDLGRRIRALEKSIHQSVQDEADRFSKMRDKADWLFDNNLKLKKWFVNLRSRIECVEHSMGFYGAQEKYKS